MEIFRLFKNCFAKANNKIDELWQSNDENYINVKYWMVLFIIGVINMVSIIPNYDDMLHTIRDIIMCYFAMWCCFVSVVAGLTHLYVFGSKKHKKFCVRLLRFTYKLILLLLIIISSPFIMMLFLAGVILNQRAKKIGNIINLSSLIFIIIFICTLLFPINVLLIRKTLNYVDVFFTINNINYNGYFIFILLYLLISMVEISIITKVSLRIIKWYRLKKIKKRESQKTINIDSQEEVEYDLNYFRKSVWRFELIALIILFIVAAGTKNDFPGMETEIKDAATVLTLGMLYWDKRKEWF